MKPTHVLRYAAAAGAIAGAAMGFAPHAFAALAQTGSAAGMPFDLGPSPVGLPANCPFPNGDANFIFQSGTVVQHDSSNKNGNWGGMTAEGAAEFYDGTTPLYQGHLTLWEGGGNNAQAQSENGFTLDFNGSGAAGTLHVHVDAHGTTNNAGAQTANHQNISISCG
jgi:hypothetical protein